MNNRLHAVVALAVMLGVAQVAAQTPPPAGQATTPAANAITGVVRDSSGGVIRAATVIATPASGSEVRGVTDADGRFTVTPTGSGAVVLVVRATGFSDGIRRIAVGATRRDLEIVLAAAPLTETVTVSPPPAPPKPPPPPKPPKVPSPPRIPTPAVNLAYGGLVTGMEAVQKSGGVVGAEAGARVWRNLDVFLEGGSFGDVVPQRQLDVATPLTAYLQQTQGKAAASTVKMPAVYGGIGARWVVEKVNILGWAKPYAQFSVGGARVKREPTFTLAGSDVTSSLGQYGVILGADMTATERRAAVTGGFGVLVPYRMFYVDVGYKMTGIKTAGESIKVSRLHIGIGARF